MYEYEYELGALPEYEEEFELESEYEGELEGEFEEELEGEFEGEEFLGTIARGIGGLLGESEYESELEGEFESEAESEEFLRRLTALARSAARSPALRRVGLTAARSALRGLGPVGGVAAGLLPQREYEGEFEEEFEEEFEWEAEGEFEEEGEEEFNPTRRIYPDAPSAGLIHPARRIYPDALMEHLGHAAAAAQSEAEAEAFIGALVPLAARLLPRAGGAIMRAAPGLIRGLSGVTRTLRRSPATRQLLRTVPTIMRRTASAVSQQVAQGRRVTPQSVVRTLAGQTQRVLSSPAQAAGAYRRSCAVDRRYHQAARRTPARPRAARPVRMAR